MDDAAPVQVGQRQQRFPQQTQLFRQRLARVLQRLLQVGLVVVGRQFTQGGQRITSMVGARGVDLVDVQQQSAPRLLA